MSEKYLLDIVCELYFSQLWFVLEGLWPQQFQLVIIDISMLAG